MTESSVYERARDRLEAAAREAVSKGVITEELRDAVRGVTVTVNDVLSPKHCNYAEIARECGLSRAHVSRVLQGKIGDSTESAERIAQAAGVSVIALHAYIENLPLLSLADPPKSSCVSAVLSASLNVVNGVRLRAGLSQVSRT